MLLSVVLTARISWIAKLLAGRLRYARKVLGGFNCLKQARTTIITTNRGQYQLNFSPGPSVCRGIQPPGSVKQLTESCGRCSPPLHSERFLTVVRPDWTQQRRRREAIST